MINDFTITMYLLCLPGMVYHHCVLYIILILSARLGTGVVCFGHRIGPSTVSCNTICMNNHFDVSISLIYCKKTKSLFNRLKIVNSTPYFKYKVLPAATLIC